MILAWNLELSLSKVTMIESLLFLTTTFATIFSCDLNNNSFNNFRDNSTTLRSFSTCCSVWTLLFVFFAFSSLLRLSFFNLCFNTINCLFVEVIALFISICFINIVFRISFVMWMFRMKLYLWNKVNFSLMCWDKCCLQVRCVDRAINRVFAILKLFRYNFDLTIL